jgi:hypothetical protein
MAAQATRIAHVGVLRQAVSRQEMRNDVRGADGVHLDETAQARFGVTVQAGHPIVRRCAPLVIGRANLVAVHTKAGLPRDSDSRSTRHQDEPDKTREDDPSAPMDAEIHR